MLQSRIEKAFLVITGLSIPAVALWWWNYDFFNAGLVAYLPFLIPPVSATVYWLTRDNRLKEQVALWEAIMNPFPTRDFPDKALVPERHGVGWMEVRGAKLGAVLSMPGEDGIFLRMAMNHERYRDKLIPWREIARLTYLKGLALKDFGSSRLGFVAIQFTTPRDLKMVIPWRETFATQIPDRLGFQEVSNEKTTNR